MTNTTSGFRFRRRPWLPLSVVVLLFSFFCAYPSLTYGVGQDYTQDSAAAGSLTLFRSEEQAQKHCPQDTVVWLNLPSGIYHFKGQRWYGNTNNGAYVCEQEADQAGDRATRNGQ
jgi:hypothetical protein